MVGHNATATAAGAARASDAGNVQPVGGRRLPGDPAEPSHPGEGHLTMAGSVAVNVIPATSLIRLDLIQTDPDLQMREAGLDVGVVAEYAEALEAGAVFPAITVFFDGDAYWPADGFHRIAAAKKIGRETISADVHDGGKRDAVLHATGVNAKHGLRRTSADKRRAILTVLRDPEWSRMSDREIGKRCWVDHKTVGSVRREITGGEIPTTARAAAVVADGEIPTVQQEAVGGSMVERMLAKASDAALISECRRRGLEVPAYAD
jgi:hypothetical protein